MTKESISRNRKIISVGIILFAVLFVLITTEGFDLFVGSFFADEYLIDANISHVSAGGVYEVNALNLTGSSPDGSKTLVSYDQMSAKDVIHYTNDQGNEGTGLNKYWQQVTINSEGYGITTDAATHALKGITLDKLYSNNFSRTTASTGYANLPVITPNAGSTVRYSVNFSDTGTYSIYVYSPDNDSPTVNYYLIDSAEDEIGFPTSGNLSNKISLTPIEGCNGWYSGVLPTIEKTYWEALELTVVKSSGKSGACTGHNKTYYTVSADDKYYNAWSAPSVYFATTLTLEFSNCSLGPIAQQGSTLTVTNDNTAGTLTYTDAFGRSGINELGWVVFTPTALEGSVFTGFGSSVAITKGLIDGTFVYKFDTDGAALTSVWEVPESLATISVSGSDTYDLNFYDASVRTVTSVQETYDKYVFNVNYETDTAIKTLKYTVTGEDGKAGEITADSDPLEVTVGWLNTVVVFEAETADKKYTITYTITKTANTSRGYVAQNSTTKFRYIEEALMNTTSGTIVVLDPGNAKPTFLEYSKANPNWKVDDVGYTVRSGVKFVVPYSDDVVEPSTSDDNKYTVGEVTSGTTGAADPNHSTALKRTLTIPSDVEIIVQNGGVIAVGGAICNSANERLGATAVKFAKIVLEGKITLNGVLSSCGYITSVTGDGIIECSSTAQIYQPYVIQDWHGGSAAACFSATNSLITNPQIFLDTKYKASRVQAFMRFSLINIQTDILMVHGSTMNGYVNIYTSQAAGGLIAARDNKSVVPIIGSGSTILNTYEGSTIYIEYDSSKYISNSGIGKYIGKTTLTVNGGAYLGAMVVKIFVPGLDYQEFSTSSCLFNIPYNFDINLNGEGSQYEIGYSIAFFPGSTLRVGEGATLNLNPALTDKPMRFVVYDGFVDKNSNNNKVLYPTYSNLQSTYGSNGSGNFIVNGTLNIGANVYFGGIIQTEVDGATISTENVTTSDDFFSVSTQIGGTGTGKVLTNSYTFASATVKHLEGMVCDNATGKLVKLVAGQTYQSKKDGEYTVNSFVYDYHSDSANPTNFTTATVTGLNAKHVGSWYNYEVTLTEMFNGNPTGEAETLYFCYNADVSERFYYSDTACSQKVDKIENGNPLYTSVVCEDHNFVVKTNTDGGMYLCCSNCNTFSGTISYNNNTANCVLYLFDDDLKTKYFVMITAGANKYLVENVTLTKKSNHSELSFDLTYAENETFETKLPEGAVITAYEDNAVNNHIKLRGYQVSGASIRFYSSLLYEFCGDKTASGDKTMLSNLGKIETYMKLTYKLNGVEGSRQSGVVTMNSVYNYLYQGDTSVFSFEDSYVFSIKTNLAVFANAGVTDFTLTLVETVYTADGTSYTYEYPITITFEDGAISSVSEAGVPGTDYIG